MSPQIPPGTTIGRYEIRSQIGAGGMGEVYLARDTELDRLVALKVLPAALSTDQQRMRRFVQEAKSASGLNHQNIITIYEIGEVDSTRFIATEFVEGVTLRQQLKRGRLGIHEVLEIGIQIASGLAAAHDAGIVHRDIKPENIMLRSRDGFVKVLDFGLVKLTEAPTNMTDTEAPTRALVNTDAGTVMGTVVYMSPEQARGKEVDERTDIWSLGVVLYEMITGSTPFSGESSADVIAAIMKSEPPPISRFVPEVPEKFADILTKALEKNRDDRYQTIKDLLVDLRRLKKRIDFESEMDRSAITDGSQSIHQSHASTAETASTSQTLSLNSVRPTSSAEYIVSEIKRHKTGAVLIVFGALIVLGTAGFLWIKSSAPPQSTVAPSMKITKLTSGGRVNGVLVDGSTSISPDGKYVVFTLIDAGKVSLWVRQISTGSDVQIAPPTLGGNNGTTISKDGEFVYYVATDVDDGNERWLYQVPILGGTPRKILKAVRGPISFSPDGKQFTFVRNIPDGDALMVANTDGSNDRALVIRKGNDWFSSSGPSWSPDGNTIAVSAGTDQGGMTYMTVMGYSLQDGSLKPLTSKKWTGEVRRVLWLPDGKGLIVPAQSDAQVLSSTQLYFVSQPDGEVRRITNDLNGYGNVSLGLTADGGTIVTVQSVPSVQLWTTNVGEPSNRAVQISHGEVDGTDGMDWMSNDQIAFFSQTGEHPELSIMKSDGSATRRLMTDSASTDKVSATPDGKYLVFSSARSGTFHIWRVNADGTNPKQITSGDFSDFSPTSSPDGQSILFASLRSGKRCLWRVPIDGGDAIQLTDRMSSIGAYTPDGESIATGYADDEGRNTLKLAIFPAAGGKPIKVIDISGANTYAGLAWALDGRAVILTFIRDGVANLWKQPIDGSSAQQLTNFTTEAIFNFALSPDGKRLAISRGHSTLDIVLIKDFR